MRDFKTVRDNSLKMKILKTLEKSKGMSLTKITEQIIISRTTIRARLSELRVNGYVTKEEPTPAHPEGRWILTETAKQFLSKDKIELKLPTTKSKKQPQVNEYLDTDTSYLE